MSVPLFLTKLLIRTGIAGLLPAVRRLTDGGSDFLHYYGDRVLAAPCRELGDAAAFLEVHGPDAIDLAAGAPRFDLVPGGSTKLPADRRGWPPLWGLPDLRTAIAGKLLADNRLAVNPADEVLVTAGAAGAVSLIFDTFLNPGDRVVLFDPVSPLYSFTLQQRRARLRWVPTKVEDGRLRFRLDLLARALGRAKLLVINSPANPTGGVIAAEDLEQIAWWADRYDVLILSDEVFERYRYEGDGGSIGAWPRAQRRTLTVGSLSKGHALASARVGWLAGCRHLIRPCVLTAALQAPFVPTVCQQIALAALRQPGEAFEPIRNEFDSRRRYAFERLRAMGLRPPWPAGAFFFWVSVAHLGLDGRAFAEGLLRAKKVLVTPGNPFGPSGLSHVRLSYATEDGRLREGLARLAEYIRELQSGTERRAA
ncbi:MAG TPA: aminotransferase class I/II-fold pyridoxal phosphate-dependent enzyme [Gemmataceae bacterium]|nr:aminotransferase class I/II-fold pyridoxal phosphate-dependent enzyme [Gemmataceae bacterium]